MDDYIYIESTMTNALDETLTKAQSGVCSLAPCLTMSGLTGSGKTSATLAWAKHNKLKYVYIDATWYKLTDIEVKYLPINDVKESRMVSGAEWKELLTEKTKVIKQLLPSDLIDQIDQDTVVIIDNYDRTSEAERLELFKYLKNLTLVDSRENETDFTKFVNPLMLVVIIDSGHVWFNPLTDEEMDLFGLDSKKEK